MLLFDYDSLKLAIDHILYVDGGKCTCRTMSVGLHATHAPQPELTLSAPSIDIGF